jgi:hypothetical protein
MSTRWDFTKTFYKTGNSPAWAAVEKLQELTDFMVNNQVLQCSTKRLLEDILRELRGLRRDGKAKRRK